MCLSLGLQPPLPEPHTPTLGYLSRPSFSLSSTARTELLVYGMGCVYYIHIRTYIILHGGRDIIPKAGSHYRLVRIFGISRHGIGSSETRALEKRRAGAEYQVVLLCSSSPFTLCRGYMDEIPRKRAEKKKHGGSKMDGETAASSTKDRRCTQATQLA